MTAVCPSKTACRIVVVACLPSIPTSDNQSEEWYQKCGFAAIVVLCRDLRGRPEWRTVMSSSAGGKQCHAPPYLVLSLGNLVEGENEPL